MAPHAPEVFGPREDVIQFRSVEDPANIHQQGFLDLIFGKGCRPIVDDMDERPGGPEKKGILAKGLQRLPGLGVIPGIKRA